MKLIKIGAAVLNQTPFAWETNRLHIVQAIQSARSQGVAVLCLPELCISGYGCEDVFHSPGLLGTCWEILQEIVPETQGMIVSVGLPLQYNNLVFNTAALAVDGQLAGFAAKRYLAGEGIHYEPRWFKPWPLGQSVSLSAGGQKYPLGDLYFDCGGIKIGFEICEDAWVADRPGGNMFLKGIDIIMNPSASHFAFGKYQVRKRFVIEGSRAFGVSYLYSNLLGNEAGRAIYDGGALIATGGCLVGVGKRFSYQDVVITSAVVDLDLTRMSQARSAGINNRLEKNPSDRIRADFSCPEVEPDNSAVDFESWEDSPRLKEEEFTRAMALGLYDYLRKAAAQGFVVSLSGGADSSAVSCLASLMVDLGLAELGVNRFLEKLPVLNTKSLETRDQIVGFLLACVYQSTANSSEITRTAARELAKALRADFFEFDVDQLVKDYVSMVTVAVHRELKWSTDDVALQNIQARVRAPGVWLLANLRGALLLATSNRSEAAVGYATMDGDTCGGLSPISGIDKAFLRQWLVWLETLGPNGLAPIPELRHVNRQEPTAELRPLSRHQTDEQDLMPYDLLDAIERQAIRDKRTPLEVLRQVQVRFPDFAPKELATWVERFFRLWCRNQWKRERYAPSFHMDDENLDPKTWCRFPILCGGFERELAELTAYVKTLDPKP